MKKSVFVGLLAGILLSFCFLHPAEAEGPAVFTEADGTMTMGNHSYIPLNLYRQEPVNNIGFILGALYTFEKNHPKLKVTHWHIEERESAQATWPILFGLWVDHEPREPGLKKEGVE